MRLIDVRSLHLVDDERHGHPAYAILSHMWTTEEVTFAIWHDELKRSSLSGYDKVINFCRVVRALGFNYAWVDTCCINKNNQAELAENINSMYCFYEGSAVCIVYLADVHDAVINSDNIGRICASRYFSRGWTLQELIAPKKVQLYNSKWASLGTLGEDPTLTQGIASSTGINHLVLENYALPSAFSIATRMSWAAHRATTKVEDMAYCLLGLFDVSMPLLYGEGRKAFKRLQEAIILRSTDHSIFAWEPHTDSHTATHDLLASSPLDFAYAKQNEVIEHYQDVEDWVAPYSLTNLGLTISLPLVPCIDSTTSRDQGLLYYAALNCRFVDRRDGPLTIRVRKRGKPVKANLQGETHAVFECNPLKQEARQGAEKDPDTWVRPQRLAVVAEESLLAMNYAKTSIIISRAAVPASSIEIGNAIYPGSNPWSPARNRRVHVIFYMPPNTSRFPQRIHTWPTQEWLRTSNTSDIWITESEYGAITFKHGGSPLTLVIRNHQESARLSVTLQCLSEISSPLLSSHKDSWKWYILGRENQEPLDVLEPFRMQLQLQTRSTMGTDFLTLAATVWHVQKRTHGEESISSVAIADTVGNAAHASPVTAEPLQATHAKAYPCNICPARFRYAKDLVRHHSRVHEDEVA